MTKYASTARQPRLFRESKPEYGVLGDEQIPETGQEDTDTDAMYPASASGEAWALDQMAKSEFFHQRLHEWGMTEVADRIQQVRGEDLNWEIRQLGISQKAWDRAIHHGVRPVTVFAHPHVLASVPRAVAYYRMLAMVSQKSMSRVGLATSSFEEGKNQPGREIVERLAEHLNRIISNLVEADETIDQREFELWRGMAAGSQAQGSWGNTKGDRTEVVVKGMLQRRIRETGLAVFESDDGSHMELRDGRAVVLADEPDFAIYLGDKIEAAVEIKGGIDTAGVLERIGAAVKSLGRAKRENPESTTILIIQGVSMTPKAYEDLDGNRDAVNHWFLVESVIDDDETRRELFRLLGLLVSDSARSNDQGEGVL